MEVSLTDFENAGQEILKNNPIAPFTDK